MAVKMIGRILGLLLAVSFLANLGCTTASSPRKDDGMRRAVNALQIVEATDSKGLSTSKANAKPQPFRGEGRLVCLLEEMKRLHGVAVDPVHDHLIGFRVDSQGAPSRYLTVLRTRQSKALFLDKRFFQNQLVLYGRTFPASSLLEVSGWHWRRDGKLYEVYYWCDVCAIRGLDPGVCDCCQGEVELREELKKP